MELCHRILGGVETLEATSHAPLAHAVQVARDHQATLLIAFILDTKGYVSLKLMNPHGFLRLQVQASSRLERCKVLLF